MRIPCLIVTVMLLVGGACRPKTTRSQKVDLSGAIATDPFEASAAAGGDESIVVSFDDPPESLAVGASFTRSFTVTAARPIAKLQLSFAADSAEASLTVDLALDATSFTFTAPLTPAAAARVRLSAADESGRVGWRTSAPFAITQKIGAPISVSRTSPAITNDLVVSFVVTNCAGYSRVYVSEEAVAPNEQSPAWPCVSGSPQTFTITGGEGPHTISVYGIGDDGLVSPAAEVNLTLDTVPPDPPSVMLVTPRHTQERDALVTVLSCDLGEEVIVSASATTRPAATDSAFVPCAIAPEIYPLTLPGMDAEYVVYVWGKDQAQNVSLISTELPVTLDRVAPVVALPTINAATALLATHAYQVTYTATDLHLDATASVRAEVSLDNGGTWGTTGLPAPPFDLGPTFTWTTPSSQLGIRLRLFVTDLAGNVGSVTSPSFLVTSSPPALSQLLLNGEGAASCTGPATTTASETAQAAIVVTDPIGAPITDLCVRTRSTVRPAPNDPCFKPVPSPATTIMTTVPVALGYVKGPLTVRMWVKNSADVVSNLQASGDGIECADRRSITYDPGVPPQVDTITAFVTDSRFFTDAGVPKRQYTQADVTLAPSGYTGPTGSSGPVYVKWNVDFGAIGPRAVSGTLGPIELSYSLSDAFGFVPINTPSGLSNGSNGTACTPGTGQSGCYVWSPPPGVRAASYVQVRVRAVNTQGVASATTSPIPLNQWPVRFLVGNPDPGYGGHALSTLFMSHLVYRSGWTAGRIAASSLGVFYFYDPEIGLLWVNPTTGSVEPLIRTTGVITDDASGLDQATIGALLNMTTDKDDNLVFWDQDHIRRVNVAPDGTPSGAGVSVVTLVDGSKGTDFFGQNQDPLTEVLLAAPYADPGVVLAALPNGDIYFQTTYASGPLQLATPGATQGAAMRRYHDVDPGPGVNMRVDTIFFTGDGYWAWDGGYLSGSFVNAAPSDNYFIPRGMSFDASGVLQFYLTTQDDVYPRKVLTYDASGSAAAAAMGITIGPCAYPYGLTRTGADGKYYCWSAYNDGGLYRYDLGDYLQNPSPKRSNLFTQLIHGVATDPRCKDGSLAIGCWLDLQDFFVDRAGTVYVLAEGIVYVLTTDGHLVRVFGQGFDTGRVGSALNTRFGFIPSVGTWHDTGSDGASGSPADDRERIITTDSLSLRIEETILANGVNNSIPSDDTAEGTITLLAGNGEPKTVYDSSSSYVQFDGSQVPPGNGVTGATGQPVPIDVSTTIAVDPENGFVYLDADGLINIGAIIPRLRRDLSEPKWEIFAGGGEWNYGFAGPAGISGCPGAAGTSGPSGVTGPTGLSGPNGCSGMPARELGLGYTAIWGFDKGTLLASMNQGPTWPAGGYFDGFAVTIDADPTPLAPNLFSLFAGDFGTWSGSFCADNPAGSSSPTNRLNCHIVSVYKPVQHRAVHHDGFSVTDAPDPTRVFLPGWIIYSFYGSAFTIFNLPDDPTEPVMRVMPNTTVSSAFTLRIIGSSPHIYYCNIVDNVLYDADLEHQNDSPAVTPTALPTQFPLHNGKSILGCDGQWVDWDEAHHALRFTYVQNGLHGVAEYLMP